MLWGWFGLREWANRRLGELGQGARTSRALNWLWEGCHHIDFPAGLGNQTLGSTGPIATPVGPPGALACSRLKSIIQASQFNVVAAPTPGGGGRPEGTKPPLRVSDAVQKPAGTPPRWVAAGGGRI